MPEQPEERVKLAEGTGACDTAPRSECSGENPEMNWSAVILTYETEAQENLLLQERSSKKERKPGYHEITAGHVMETDASLENAAIREYAEELHNRDPGEVDLSTEHFEYVGTVRKDSEDNPEMLAVYQTVYQELPTSVREYTGDLSPEVETAWFEPVEHILERKESQGSNFTDSAIQVLETVEKESY